MSDATVFGLCAAAAVGLGLFGVITNPRPLRKLLAFNVLGAGVFLFFGVVARRGALGAPAILFGSVVALRQKRLKLLIAYSTLAQIGFLFLMFPLAFDPAAARLQSGNALTGGMLQAMSHATAKAAMFMAAGLIYEALGHDRMAGLAGVRRALPMTVVAFAVAGVALMARLDGIPGRAVWFADDGWAKPPFRPSTETASGAISETSSGGKCAASGGKYSKRIGLRKGHALNRAKRAAPFGVL
jgi:formate hydrogenlyase subunit 3/multisubunit Na+/H+ antiporter MnhD subunit